MATTRPTPIPTLRDYNRAATEAFRSQTLEEIMESTTQSTQRGITVAAFDMIRAVRSDIHCFSELMILYPKTEGVGLSRVVPDNMVVVYPGQFGEKRSFNVPREPVRPLLVMEYVSKGNPRKDYVANRERYERHVRVPYYYLFEPDKGRHTLYHMPTGKSRYAVAGPNPDGRVLVPELELEIGLIDGWARYWFRRALVPLSVEMAGRLRAAEDATWRAEESVRRAEESARRAEDTARSERVAREAAEAENARLKAELDRLRRPQR